LALCQTPASEYRSFNGTGNNILNPLWGSNNQGFKHPVDVFTDQETFFYDDGISVPRGGFPISFTLPPERRIRNDVIYGQGDPDPAPSSDWAWVVGEYLAFETVKTSGNASEPWNIPIDPTDPYYANHNGQISFGRCIYEAGTGTSSLNPRVQTNGASSWIDAQTIYGENDATAAYMRLGTQGLLKYQPGPDGELPPFYGNVSLLPAGVSPVNPSANVPTSQLFALGSPRVNQQPQSMCLNILYRREHNRLARELLANNPSWDDYTTFQEARRRVIAYMQHFYEFEYMPMLLGNPGLDPYPGYDSTVDPAVNAMFNEVSLRYGHTQVNNITWRLNNDGSHSLGGDILLRDVFFDPTFITMPGGGGCSSIWFGLNAKVHNSPEVNIVDDLKEFVFAHVPNMNIDLISTNMRRGRDMGLPSFGAAKAMYNLTVFTHWDNFTEWGAQLTKAYNTTDPSICDPWLCGIIDGPFPTTDPYGGELGELNHVVVKQQFEKLRNGDRFWYLNGQFDTAETNQILSTKLANIILRNSQVAQMPCDLFEVPNKPYLPPFTPGPVCTNPGPTSTASTAAATTSTFHTTGTSGSGASSVVVSVALIVLALVALLL